MAESLTVDGVMNALRNCYDPEIPVNIVDLGLIYGVAIDDDSVKVRMTLTTIGCPAHAYLMNQVQTEIEKIPGVKKAEVEIVWEPPWTPGPRTCNDRIQSFNVQAQKERAHRKKPRRKDSANQ